MDDQELLPRSQNNQKKASIVVAVIMIISGMSFFTVMISNAIYISNDCGGKLGKEVWEGSYPRYVFLDGPFQTPKCHFGTVEVINAPGKGVKQLTKYMGYLVNLTKLSLPENDIVNLPREITKLKKISSVNLQGNPVWTHLNWTH